MHDNVFIHSHSQIQKLFDFLKDHDFLFVIRRDADTFAGQEGYAGAHFVLQQARVQQAGAAAGVGTKVRQGPHVQHLVGRTRRQLAAPLHPALAPVQVVQAQSRDGPCVRGDFKSQFENVSAEGADVTGGIPRQQQAVAHAQGGARRAVAWEGQRLLKGIVYCISKELSVVVGPNQERRGGSQAGHRGLLGLQIVHQRKVPAILTTKYQDIPS